MGDIAVRATNSLPSQRIQVWRRDVLSAVETDIRVTQIIGDNDDDIRPARFRGYRQGSHWPNDDYERPLAYRPALRHNLFLSKNELKPRLSLSRQGDIFCHDGKEAGVEWGGRCQGCSAENLAESSFLVLGFELRRGDEHQRVDCRCADRNHGPNSDGPNSRTKFRHPSFYRCSVGKDGCLVSRVWFRVGFAVRRSQKLTAR